ncbi:MAG: MAPEG family protein [Burkholderiales bacterium]|nr:MAPEG family protein [Burkholderiales bacterium]
MAAEFFFGAAATAQTLSGGYVLLRYLHTAVYLRGLQPWRALLFLSGMLICWLLALAIIDKIWP